MSWLRHFLLRLVNAAWPTRPERELDREVRAHLALLEADFVARGLSPGQAQRAAAQAIGGIDQLKEQHRDARSFRWVGDAWRDASDALRLIRHHRRLAAAAILTIGLAVGAVTVVFGVFESVVLRALPRPGGDRLVSVAYTTATIQFRGGFSHRDVATALSRWPSFDAVGWYQFATTTPMTVAAGSESVVTAVVSPNFFSLFGVKPILGRPFEAGDGSPDHDAVVMLAHSLWQQEFGADPDIVGKSLRLGGVPYRVVGVMPAGFNMPVPWMQVWLPDVATARELNYDGFTHQVIARLASGRSIKDAQRVLSADHQSAFPQIHASRGWGSSGSSTRLSAISLRDQFVGPAGFAATLLLAVVILVLLIACVNVAMLLLARNAGRQREFAVRVALGARPWRLAWQSWIESLFLCVGGGLLAAGIAFPSLRVIRDLGPTTVPRLRESVVDTDVLVAGFLAVGVASVLIGVLPALRARVPSLAAMGTTRAWASGARGFLRGLHLEGLLTVAQAALVLLLVAVAGLLLRSVTKVLTIDPGFHPNGVIAVQLQTEKSSDVDLASVRLLADQLRRIPGVQAVAAAEYLKFVPRQPVEVVGSSNDPTPLRMVAYQIASPEYFTTLGIPFLTGHTFPADPDGASTCVVNQLLAEAAWPGQDPLGQIVDPGLGQCTVVGVVGNTRERIETEPGPELYYPDSGRHGSVDGLLIRLSSDLPGVRSTILARIKAIDPYRRIESTESVADVLFTNIPTPPFYAMVFGWFGALALILAAVGVHGMMGQVVARRWNEIGVRLTVGARPVDVWLMMVLFVAKLLLGGVAIGLVAAVWMARSMGSMLYDLAPSDPATLTGATLVVLLVGLGAAIVPSLRASRIDPTVLLRSE
jgi:predicted permease